MPSVKTAKTLTLDSLPAKAFTRRALHALPAARRRRRTGPLHALTNGLDIHIPPMAVRVGVAVLAAAAVGVAFVQGPDAWRYVKIESM